MFYHHDALGWIENVLMSHYKAKSCKRANICVVICLKPATDYSLFDLQ